MTKKIARKHDFLHSLRFIVALFGFDCTVCVMAILRCVFRTFLALFCYHLVIKIYFIVCCIKNFGMKSFFFHFWTKFCRGDVKFCEGERFMCSLENLKGVMRRDELRWG